MEQVSNTPTACIIHCTLPFPNIQLVSRHITHEDYTLSELGGFGIDDVHKFGLERCTAHEESVDIRLGSCADKERKDIESDS